MQLLLVGTDKLLMSPPLWGEGLTCCVLSEGEQRSTELSTQFYAIQIFQDAHHAFQTKSSICRSMKLIVQHKIISDHVRLKKKNHCDIYLTLALHICKITENFVPNVFLIHNSGLVWYHSEVFQKTQESISSSDS